MNVQANLINNVRHAIIAHGGEMVSRENCPICRAREHGVRQMYTIQGEAGRYVFDVALARQIANDGRTAHPIHGEPHGRLLVINEWEPAHLDHVDVRKPGLMGPRFGGWILIDGIHRAARAWREHRTFQVYLLTFEELQSCLISGPVLTPEKVAREIRATLSGTASDDVLNVEIEMVTATRQETETAVRACLSPDENSRIHLIIHGRKNGGT